MDKYELPGGAFIIEDGGRVARVSRESFPDEAHFQELIAFHPELLAGDLLSPENPRRWLLIDREMGIADSEDGADRWAVDHVFVDQDATPTFVEVKRRSDGRLKRDVIGQILSYVAFSTAYLTGDRLREHYEKRIAREGGEPDEMLAATLQSDLEPDDFWESVGRKLRSGEVRALIVADEIPRELRRVLEFVNSNMEAIDLLGVELQLYSAEGYRTLVPRVVGQTAEAEDRKQRPSVRAWNEDAIRAEIKASDQPGLTAVLDRLLEWAASDDRIRIEYGRGSRYGSMQFRTKIDGRLVTIFQAYTGPDRPFLGVMSFGNLMTYSAEYADDDSRLALARRVQDEVDPELDTDQLTRYPEIRFALDPEGHRIVGIIAEVLDRVNPKSEM